MPIVQGMKKYLTQVYIRFSGNDNTKIFSSLAEAKEFWVAD
jgi:hypothetical protein